jgi:hypothetical protein
MDAKIKIMPSGAQYRIKSMINALIAMLYRKINMVYLSAECGTGLLNRTNFT